MFPPVLIAFNKPWGVLSQFTADGSANRTLAEFGFPQHVYPLGRLDADSEGLLLLTDEPGLNSKLLDPARHHSREYMVQVERIPSPEALRKLSAGVRIQGYLTLPCRAVLLEQEPAFEPRVPPIRHRKNVPTCWVSISLREGKNRQVRRMTAAVGHPTLRLVRVAIGKLRLEGMPPGQWRLLTPAERAQVFESPDRGYP